MDSELFELLKQRYLEEIVQRFDINFIILIIFLLFI